VIGARSSDHGGHIYFPQDSLIDELLKLIEQVVKRNGGDRNIGRHLRALFIETGIERVEASPSALVWSKEPDESRWREHGVDILGAFVCQSGG
jgi:hypothetical protein